MIPHSVLFYNPSIVFNSEITNTLNIIYLLFHTLQEFYTDNPKTFEDYGRIINQRHFKRVMALMEGSTVAVGGDNDESQCYIGTCCVRAKKHLHCDSGCSTGKHLKLKLIDWGSRLALILDIAEY